MTVRLHWADSRVALYVADATALCHTFAGQAQLVVTSPPYNVSKDYQAGAGDRLPLDGYLAQLASWIRACAAALRPGGVLALNLPFNIATNQTRSGGFKRSKNWQGPLARRAVHQDIHPTFSTYPITAWAELEVIAAGLLPRRGITWVKSPTDGHAYATTLAMGNSANPFMRPASERIVLASKDRYGRDGTNGRLMGWEMCEVAKDVWHISSNSGHRVSWHPAPFPEELPQRLIDLFTSPGDLVLDPFAGSFTTAAVAARSGRRFVGGDLSEEYVAKGTHRVRYGVKATELINRGQAVLIEATA